MASAVTIGELLGEVLADLTTASKSFADVQDYGAVGNGVTDCRTAFAAADTAGLGIVVRGGTSAMYKIASNLTISSLIIFGAGAQITIPTGVTLTLNGGILAPTLRRLFVLSGTGKVVFGPKTEYANVEWFGAGQGVTDDLAACNDCFAACKDNVIELRFNSNLSTCPSAEFAVTSYVPIRTKPNVLVVSSGAVNFMTISGAGAGIMTIPSFQGFSGRGLRLYGTAYYDVTYVYSNGNGTDVTFETDDTYTNCTSNTVRCTYSNGATYPVKMKSSGSTSGTLPLKVMQGNAFVASFVNDFSGAGLFINVGNIYVAFDGFRFSCDALDVNQHNGACFVLNDCSAASPFMPRLHFEVLTWLGGFQGNHSIKTLNGSFAGSYIYFANANDVSDANHWTAFNSTSNNLYYNSDTGVWATI